VIELLRKNFRRHHVLTREECHLGRVINIDSSGKERALLTRNVVIAIQELMRQDKIDVKTRDLAAFITLALQAIWKTIDTSVEAWEKRGYWLKADRFRMEWEWTNRLGQRLHDGVMNEDWDMIAQISVQVAEKLKSVKLPKRLPKSEPWDGAWEKLHLIKREER
jgi:hypothetical protein